MSSIIPVKEQRLGNFFNQRQAPGSPDLPVMSVTMNDSLVLRESIERRLESALRPDQHLLVKKGDIAYNMMRMWQGACGLALTDGIVSPAYVVLEPKPGIDSRFAYHWFKSARMIHLFRAFSHGLTEDRLRLYFNNFCEIPAAPPSLSQQRLIADLLDAWDAAIDQTLRLVTASRARRSALLRTIYGTARVTATMALPEGWGRERVGDICEFSSGLWEGTKPPLERVGVVRNTNFTEDGVLDDFDVASLEVEGKQLATRRLSIGDIILEKSGGGPDQPVGRVAMFDWSGGPYSFSNFTSVLRVRQPDRINNRYLHNFLHWVYLSGLTEVMQSRSTGIRNLDGDYYKDILVPIAPMEKQLQIVSVMNAEQASVGGLLEKVRLLRNQKRSLVHNLLVDQREIHQDFDSSNSIHGAAQLSHGSNGTLRTERRKQP
jgi:type I restriction enzyme S subunit